MAESEEIVQIMSAKFAKKQLHKLMVFVTANGFDVDFYRSHYNDVKFMSDARALKHFIRHGRAENRALNESDYRQKLNLLENEINGKFDLLAYKFYNKDLLSAFVSDEQFIRHYLDHGYDEGRQCQFDNDSNPAAIILPEDMWRFAFSSSEFIAWCGDKLDKVPANREEALRVFHDIGIDELWPISFKYAFDANFVRENAIIPGHEQKSDSDLYRDWLAQGFPAGLAPNEGVFLAPYLGTFPFPAGFEWRAVARRVGLPSGTTRSQVLAALFDQSTATITRNVDLMGQDAGWLLEKIGRRAMARQDYKKAIVLFQQSCEFAPLAEQLCLLGDAHRASGAMDKALEAYAASIAAGRAPISSSLNAAKVLASEKDFSAAFTVMRAAFTQWRHKVEFSRTTRELAQSYFEHQSARAHALLRETAGQEAGLSQRLAVDVLLTETLDEILKLYSELENLPAATGGNPEGYIAILANDGLRQCNHYRIEQKVLQFNSADISVRVFSHSEVEEFIDSLVGARAAIFYRVAATPEIMRAILHANSMGLDTYYEIDDLIFDASCYPDPYASFEGQITLREYAGLQFGVQLFKYAMAMCKGSIASTPALSERMQEITKTRSSIVIRNGLDERNDTAITIGEHPIRHDHRRVRIFYGSGTKAHNADFNRLVAPALLDLMKRFPQVNLVIVGHLKPMAELNALIGRIFTFPFIPDVTTYWSMLASCDINLAVLETGAVADCKSEIKWLEAAVLQVPSIVSATRTYREILEDGRDGFLAASPSQWHQVLESLIVDGSLRASVGAKAREKALREYSVEKAASILTEHFGAPARAVMKRPRDRLKVLICNVFYAPQSYGGATRVVEENVRIFQDSYPDLDIGVFCSEEGGSPPRKLRMGSENGIPVYRLSIPQEADMDWTPFNDDNTFPFQRVLDHFQPDVIHFHCIQRLTATIVEAALSRGIPYIVTVHDGWWISDHQFLVDEDGFLQLPGTDVLADCESSRHGTASIARRQRLASLLQNAQAVLSVSTPFAEVYTNAGIKNVTVVENGTPVIEPAARTARDDGRVALGHIGGRSAHKGAALIEAALRKNEFKHLHLTMVDGALGPGQSINTVWGSTPVTLIAPVPQSDVAQLYGALDVLLAPSTWPESYGLVTREALQSGLWVVASDLGAIGQDIVEGKNGNVINVETTARLCQVLRQMDDDPERYIFQQSSKFEKSMRRSCQQAAKIYSYYKAHN